jgi:hypothetical protein
MHADIQQFAQQMTQAGLPQAQIKALQSMLNDVNHHTLSYVSSATNVNIAAIGFIGIIVINLFLTSVGKLTGREKADGRS